MKGTGSLLKATKWSDGWRVGLGLAALLLYVILFIPVYHVSWISRSVSAP